VTQDARGQATLTGQGMLPAAQPASKPLGGHPVGPRSHRAAPGYATGPGCGLSAVLPAPPYTAQIQPRIPALTGYMSS